MIREVGGPGFVIGNHVVIRGDDGVYAAVAHLQQGSAAVRAGDRVTAGTRIGGCGNSGNSSEPHVHAQLMDRASFWTAQGVPMAFAGIAIGDDPEPADALPANEQHMTAAGRPQSGPA
jgi:murein DD-endopeptidase MepM/ murein hydrolase activator NlpD